MVLVVYFLNVRLAIRRPNNESEWEGWQDIPDRDIQGTVNHRLYDDDANAIEIEVYVWDGDEPPEPVEEALDAGVLELRP